MTRDQIASSLRLWQARLRTARRNAHKGSGVVTKQEATGIKAIKARIARRVGQLKAPPKPPKSVSQGGVALVARFEGFRSWPYRDAVGVWTIGYGETRGVGPTTKPWSQAYAAQQLKDRLNRDFLPAVLAAAQAGGLTLRQHEIDALTSLAYNLGPGIFGADHSIGAALRRGDRAAAANAFLLYDKAGGKTLPGLSARRREERALFLG